MNETSLEEGLAAEFEFRRKHFESMMEWPVDDERVLTLRDEDILGDEEEVFEKVFRFFEQPEWIVKRAKQDAHTYRAGGKEVHKGHVRNPRSKQWQSLFTPRLKDQFSDLYEPLLRRYGYPEK